MMISVLLIFLLLLTGCTSSSDIAGGAGTETTNSIFGQVFYPQGNAVENASVRIRPAEYLSNHDSTPTSVATVADGLTDNNGVFYFDSVTTGTYSIEINDRNNSAILISFETELTSQDFILPPDTIREFISITGTVQSSDERNISATAHIYGIERDVEINPVTGLFTFEDLPEGSYTILISPISGDYASLEVTTPFISSGSQYSSDTVTLTNQTDTAISFLNNYYTIVNESSGLPLSIENGNTEIQSPLTQGSDNGAIYNYWRVEEIEDNNYYLFNAYSDNLINTEETDDITLAIQDRNRNSIYNSWTLEPIGNEHFRIVNYGNSLALGVSENDASVVLSPTTDNDRQLWRISRLSATKPAPDFSLYGFATLGNGTTGGGSGDTVTVRSAQELIEQIQSPLPLTIQISGTIELPHNPVLSDPSRRMFHIASNKTIEGLSGAQIFDGGFIISDATNIIIRNITFSNAADDAISIEEGASNIWINRNTFSDCTDGLVDIKRQATYITLSWNKFYNQNSSSIIGHDDSHTDDRGFLMVTLHHNYWYQTAQNHPRVRYGKVHLFNNLYQNISEYTVGIGVEAEVIAENQYTKDANRAVQYYDSPSQPGFFWDRGKGSIHSGIEHDLEFKATDSLSFEWLPEEYYQYPLYPALEAKYLVETYAGAH
ncbi:RICIN domain-containing protein [Chitinispirillales bacterium ANBcel5]|uniref:pectate lyase family protein n=1 Tax=Cellulosispirillum alkaliphilum TaxID=3039283 RepID=UPI002A558A89|nr:RICIN domain-containing protein [Chitinispirillales bacterium ANBcel5]